MFRIFRIREPRVSIDMVSVDEKKSGGLTDFERYKELRNEITYEANLAVGRTSWFVASQAFLFTSLANAIKTTGSSAAIRDSLFYPLIPIVGMLVSIITLVSVGAALNRAWHISQKIKDDFHKYVEYYQIKESGATTIFGSLSTFAIPILFAAVWFGMLMFYR